MEAGASGTDLVSPAEADWPPELRLPAPPPPPLPSGMDDSQFLGSIVGDSARQGPADPLPLHGAAGAVAPAGPRKRGRPPKKRDGAVAAAPPAKPSARRREDEEEVVCFICFDGGNLVVCDRRGCPKVYHPACIKRDESFFNSRTKWNCGWHICSSCEKAVHYMCYTCTYSLCKVCIKQGKFFSVRGTKGFCDTCFGTILLIESKDEAATKVDFDDINSWEYLFKLYWLDLKGKLSLTLEELTSAKSRWTVPNTSTRKEKEESSDDLYDINNDDDAGSDYSSRKRKRNSSKKRGRKRKKVNSICSITTNKAEPAIRDAGSLATKVPTEGVSLPVDAKWASPELLEFVGHMRNGDQSFISPFDVQTDLLEYIKKNNLRDPKRKSQIICDVRLHRLFRKTRVAHFEMLKLLEMHFLVNQTSEVNDNCQVAIDLNSAQVDANGYSDLAAKLSPDKRRRMHRKMEREPQVNPEAYAAVDMHNVNLIYMRRNLMEDLIDDAAFLEKIYGAFVRIKISGVGQKQDMYRLVKVVGIHKVPEKYSIGKKTTNFALEILNLDKKEIITMDTISNQDFTEEECNRLRQSMKCGLISRLKVGAVQEKAKVLQSVRVNDWLENEKQRLEHLRDRASETGRKKELRECVEKLQLLNNSEERTRRINEVLEVHVDPHMDPNYESAEEMDVQKSVGVNANRTRTDTSVSRRKSKYPKSTLNHIQQIDNDNHQPKILSREGTIRGSRTGRKFENLHHTNGMNIPRPSTMCDAGSVSSSVLTMSSETEPEKVWHYKDPAGNVQGPFTLMQLSKWTSYFPRDLRVWLTFESEERSLLLTEVLSKQQTVFTQTTSVTATNKATSTGIERNKNNLSADQINSLSPTGYSMLNSSAVTVQSNKYSVPERESVYSPEDCLSLSTSSVQPKYVHTLNSQVQCQTKHSVFVQSPGSPYGQTDLHHDRAHRGCSDESNHRHSSITMKNSIMAHSSDGKNNVASHHQNQDISWSQNQNHSKNSSQGVSMKDMSKNLPTQRVAKDAPSPLFAWSPSESRTASSQHDGSCLSSTANPNFLDEHHSFVASTKPKCCAPATPTEDRGSSSPSGMLSHSERVPICSPQSAPSASVSDMCRIEEMMSQQRTPEADTSNDPVYQSTESKIFLVSSPGNQDIDRDFPSPTPRPENNEPLVDNSGLKPASPDNLAHTYSPVSDSCKMEEIVEQHKILETGASVSSANHNPQSEVLHVSSSNNKDLEPESAESDNKEPAVDNPLVTSAATENQRMASASGTDTCMMDAVNQQKTLEEDASKASFNMPPRSDIFPVSSTDDQDIEHAHPNPTRLSGNKAPTESLRTTSASNTDTCKMEATMNQQKPLEEDVPNASNDQYPDPSINQDIECAYPNPVPRPENKEPTENLRPASASDVDTCKMEATMNQQKTLEEDISNASTNWSPRSNTFPVSSTANQDIECAYPNTRSGNKEPTENLGSASASDADTCKMEVTMNQQKTLEEDVSNTPANWSPRSSTFPVSSMDNQDIDTCKMEATMNQQKTLEQDVSNAPANWSPRSSTFPVSSMDNQDIERACPSPILLYGNKEPSMDNSGLKSAAPENLSTATDASNACKMKILGKKITIETDTSDGSITPPKVSLVSSPNNQDIEHEFSGPAPESENKKPLMDNSPLTSAKPENETTTASASGGCKMEMLDKKTTLETDASNSSVAPPPRSEDFLAASDNHDIQCEYPSPTPRPENKEPVVDALVLTLAAPDDLTGTSPDACALPKSVPPTGKLDAMGSDFKGVEEIIQNGLYSESTVVTKENMAIDPSCGAESIDVSDVLESLMEQRCGAPYMHGTAALEDFLAASAEEEPQCSSPIALSPWGEPSYYQGDAVDSALWGVEDDPVNDMWSLLSPTPMLQPSSAGFGTKASEILDINEVAMSHGINESFQRGPMLGEENVKNAISSAAADWVLPEQVKSKPNDVSAPSVDENTEIVGWQSSTNQNLSAGTASGTSHNIYLPGCEKAVTSSKSSWEASRKQESTYSSVSSSGEAIGNTNKSWNLPSISASRGNPRNHRRGRYSEISESWLLSSNNSRSRSDRFGSGGSSRSTLNGKSRSVCKFHEGGYCRKGASCSYLHP